MKSIALAALLLTASLSSFADQISNSYPITFTNNSYYTGSQGGVTCFPKVRVTYFFNAGGMIISGSDEHQFTSYGEMYTFNVPLTFNVYYEFIVPCNGADMGPYAKTDVDQDAPTVGFGRYNGYSILVYEPSTNNYTFDVLPH